MDRDSLRAAFDPSYSPPGKAGELRTLAVAEQVRRELGHPPRAVDGHRPPVSGAARQKASRQYDKEVKAAIDRCDRAIAKSRDKYFKALQRIAEGEAE